MKTTKSTASTAYSAVDASGTNIIEMGIRWPDLDIDSLLFVEKHLLASFKAVGEFLASIKSRTGDVSINGSASIFQDKEVDDVLSTVTADKLTSEQALIISGVFLDAVIAMNEEVSNSQTLAK